MHYLHRLLRYLLGFLLLLLLFVIGEAISALISGLLPGSIIGMLLLAMLLRLGWLRLNWVADAANLLLAWMALFFVPIGAGIIDQLPLVKTALPALVITCIPFTLLLLWLIGAGYQKLERQR